MVTGFIRQADGIVFAFDLTNIETFRNLMDWVSTARMQLRHTGGDEESKVPMIIVGNKLDLCMDDRPNGSERQVNSIDANKFA